MFIVDIIILGIEKRFILNVYNNYTRFRIYHNTTRFNHNKMVYFAFMKVFLAQLDTLKQKNDKKYFKSI